MKIKIELELTPMEALSWSMRYGDPGHIETATHKLALHISTTTRDAQERAVCRVENKLTRNLYQKLDEL